VNKVPDQPAYGIGEPVDVATLVLDGAGGTISNASVELTSNPAANQQVGNRFVYMADGVYTVTATVLGDTEGGLPVTASLTVTVDGHGPAIACDSPLDGAILDQTPGSVLTVQGSVTDMSGVAEFRLNGAAAPVDASGAFAVPLTSGWGINFVDLAAVDTVGRETRRTCAFLLSDTWAPDSGTLSDTISLRARQAAFDDGSRAGGLNSFTDLLHTVLSSNGLRDTLHTNLLAANPLKPSSCDQSVLGVCVLSSQVRYVSLAIGGPNTTTSSLVANGLSNSSNATNIRLQVRVNGNVAGIPYDTTGTVTFSSVGANMIFDAALAGGQPGTSIRAGLVSTTVGSISTDFSGLDGAVINIVVDLFNGMVRNLVRDLIRDYIQNNFNSVLDGVLGGLDVRNLANTFNVPRFDGGNPLPVTFGVAFSSLNTTSTRMLTTIGTRFQATPAHARPTLGAPIPSGTRGLDVAGSPSIAVAWHVGLFDQALHALWRGGYFDATLTGGALGGLVPAGVTAEIATVLPPAARLRNDGRMEISVGAMNVQLTDPALGPDPIDLSAGGRASCAARLEGEDVVLENCLVEELHASTGRVLLGAQSQAELEQLLTDVLNEALARAVNDAVPALPMPAYELPASVATYGLPAGEELGLVNPTLSIQGNHAVFQGSFGIR